MSVSPPSWMAEWRASGRSPNLASGQQEMFPLKLTGILPELPKGAHLEFVADVGGTHYYCKRDKNGLPVRATEWVMSSLARHLNIPVPDFAPILNPENDEVLFGSKGTWGTASDVEVRTLLTTPQFYDKAVGGERPWLGSYLSRLYAFDLFVANPDRQLCNFLLVQDAGIRRLLAFDFASANLAELGGVNFPVAQSPTISVGRQLRKLHQFDLKSANEMLDWIAAVPDSAVESFLSAMPDEWLSEKEKGRISGLWSNGAVGDRLAALRSGIENESLL